jgi:hypothetical protein
MQGLLRRFVDDLLFVPQAFYNALLFSRQVDNTSTEHKGASLLQCESICLSLGIWSIPEVFGGFYLPDANTDIETASPYAIIFTLLLLLSAFLCGES